MKKGDTVKMWLKNALTEAYTEGGWSKKQTDLDAQSTDTVKKTIFFSNLNDPYAKRERDRQRVKNTIVSSFSHS